MNLQLTEEQQLLHASALDFLGAEYSYQRRQASVAHLHACHPDVWSQFAQLGWLGLPLQEKHGGLDGRCLETGLLMAALGRHLVVEPYFACVVQGARLLDASGDERHAALLAAVAAGTKRLALAHDELGREPWAPRGMRASRTHGQQWQLTGRKLLVADASGADFVIVSATDDEGQTQLFLLPGTSADLRRHPAQRTDGSQAADLSVDKLMLPEHTRIATTDAADDVLQRVLAEGMVALCWEAFGAMQAALEQTAAYTQQREQFGQPLSRFQVVQHRLAEMAVCCEESRAACELAALRLDAPCALATAQALASLAKSKVGRAARAVAYGAVQLHGGMGVCEELPVAALFRKLTSFTQLLGSTAAHGERYGRMLLADDHWRMGSTLETVETAAAAA